MELRLATARLLNVLRLVPACTTKETHMVATATSNHGNANLQALQLLGSKTDSIVTTMDLEIMADLHPLHGQLAIVVATATAATAVLLAAALHHGTSRHLLHHLHHPLSVNPAMVTVRILAMTKASVMEHRQPQLPQASARSCNSILVHLRLHQVMGHHRLRHPTTLLPRPRRLIILLHLRRRERSYGCNSRCKRSE
jgi:hypothetical protein